MYVDAPVAERAFLGAVDRLRKRVAGDLMQCNPDALDDDLNRAVRAVTIELVCRRLFEARGIALDARLAGFPTAIETALSLSEPPLELPCAVDFLALPADILGRIYERSIRKPIRVANGSIQIAGDVGAKKAPGVHYTPRYLVDYIVLQTLGRALSGLAGPSVARLSQIRLLDPACGCGAFLIAAYPFLLDWYQQSYIADGPEKHEAELRLGVNGTWRLGLDERRRILLQYIFGVELDPLAAHVTRLSLLLQMLGGTTREEVVSPDSRRGSSDLPDLSSNVKCGDALIGPDFYDDSINQAGELQAGNRAHAFDWAEEFPEIMPGGGFDVVLGNPPYFSVDNVWNRGDARRCYIRRVFSAVYRDKTDILFYFLVRAAELCRGELGFIVSRAFLEAYKADKLRSWLAEHASVREIMDLGRAGAFDRAGIGAAILFLTRNERPATATVYRARGRELRHYDLIAQRQQSEVFQEIRVPQKAFGAASWLFAESRIENTLRKIDAAGEPLGQVLLVGQGMQTGRNDVFGGLDPARLDAWGVEASLRFTRARNSDIRRYTICDRGEQALYLEEVGQFEDLPLEVQRHLQAHATVLKERAAYRRGDCDWWKYTWPLHREHIRRARIYCPYLATQNRFALDAERRFLGLTDTTVLYDTGQPEDLRYLLGLLNSRLLSFRFQFIGKLKGGQVREYFWNSLSRLPIRRIDFSDSADVARHDRMAAWVQDMLDLHHQWSRASAEEERVAIQRQADQTDREIDSLVYELYGLAPEEVGVVEGEMAR